MAVFAYLFGSVLSSLHINSMWHALKMIWIDARTRVALVQNINPGWDWTILPLPRNAMRTVTFTRAN
jgi:uncharacterized membrane protein (UPF0127 family)